MCVCVCVCVRARACVLLVGLGCCGLFGLRGAGEFEAEVDLLKLLARAEADEARAESGGAVHA